MAPEAMGREQERGSDPRVLPKVRGETRPGKGLSQPRCSFPAWSRFEGTGGLGLKGAASAPQVPLRYSGLELTTRQNERGGACFFQQLFSSSHSRISGRARWLSLRCPWNSPGVEWLASQTPHKCLSTSELRLASMRPTKVLCDY